MADEKKNVVAVVKDKAKGLVSYNEKDLKKLEKKVENLERSYKVHKLALDIIRDPKNEELNKQVNALDAKASKEFKAICNAKKIKFAVIGGSIVLIGVAATAVVKGSKKTTADAIDVEAEEVESDEDEAYEDVDENLEEDSDEESTEE